MAGHGGPLLAMNIGGAKEVEPVGTDGVLLLTVKVAGGD